MREYYYIHPTRAQYYFPTDFKRYIIFNDFFSAYTMLGRISWFLFFNFKVYRNCFRINLSQVNIPLSTIESFLGGSPNMAYNIGSPGLDRKLTGIGISNGEEIFIKVAQTNRSLTNVRNEIAVLQLLKHRLDVPRLLGSMNTADLTIMKTNVIKGRTLLDRRLNEPMLKLIYSVNSENILGGQTRKKGLIWCFSHGDFCPWNIMSSEEGYRILDWEMAGQHPLGYDLFTFIFQPYFLLERDLNIGKELEKCRTYIASYFALFSVNDYNPYLISFARIRIEIEQAKKSSLLLYKYKRLLEYVRQA